MRENMGMYRGKPKHKEEVEYSRPDVIRSDGFIYGNLVVADGKYFICTYAVCSHKTYVNNTRATMFEVIPETVGEFTGVTDKNDKKLFEGDIVNNLGDVKAYVIVFIDGVYRLCNSNHQYSYSIHNSRGYLTVIGNIVDNPELMSEREE